MPQSLLYASVQSAVASGHGCHENMNASYDAWIDANGCEARPIYFPSERHRLFGWLHLPAGAAAANIGLVICNPFGYEAVCAHRSLLAFAQSAASVGVPSLRFDYRGTGDSEDIDPATNQLDVWPRDVVAAVDELRRRTGVTRVCLMGFRLGALIASLAAPSGAGVEALIAVAPVISGRRYLKELRTIQMAAGRKADTAGTDGAKPMEVSGFSFAAATVAALMETDLGVLNPPVVPEILVIDRSESPGARAWADSLSRPGSNTQYVALPGFVRMMMTAPHLTLIPQSMITAARDWLLRFSAAEQQPLAAPGKDRSERGERQFSFAASSSGETLTETMAQIPGESKLFGIVTEPRNGELSRKGIILLNAGATHHVGPNRMYVTLARRWADRGCLVLRVDLSGVGDSPAAHDRPENEAYPASAVGEIRAAVDFMRTRYGITNVTLGGLCSGAYHALRAAAEQVAVNRIIMVNPLNFFWKENLTQTDLLRLGFIHNPDMYVRQTIPSRFWKKLVTGQVNVGRLLGIYSKYAREIVLWRVRDAARSLRLPLPQDLGNELEEIAARNIGIAFVFARGEPGVALLRHLAGAAVAHLGEACRIYTIDGADHIFSQSGPRSALESILSDELFANAARSVKADSPLNQSHINEEPVG
jgi:pimeloyl-ACP methyl ester carboxylesterase